ncbi:hypothetical protein IWX49DRAFT_59376 [Phyllosticta citricarpa]
MRGRSAKLVADGKAIILCACDVSGISVGRRLCVLGCAAQRSQSHTRLGTIQAGRERYCNHRVVPACEGECEFPIFSPSLVVGNKQGVARVRANMLRASERNEAKGKRMYSYRGRSAGGRVSIQKVRQVPRKGKRQVIKSPALRLPATPEMCNWNVGLPARREGKTQDLSRQKVQPALDRPRQFCTRRYVLEQRRNVDSLAKGSNNILPFRMSALCYQALRRLPWPGSDLLQLQVA